jgi:ABC-type molybdate transport system permease subunit
MSFTAVDLIPLLSAASAAGPQSQAFMPFVLVLAPIVLALLLLFVFGRQHRRNRDHDK